MRHKLDDIAADVNVNVNVKVDVPTADICTVINQATDAAIIIICALTLSHVVKGIVVVK
jgi:hypothetical protein